MDRIYVTRKEGEKELVSIEDCLDKFSKKYTKKSKVNKTNNENNLKINRKTEIIESRKQKWKEKQLHKHCKRQTKEIDQEMIWTWQCRRK